MQKIKFVTIVFFGLLFSSVNAQQGRVRGVVTDADNKEPLAFVNIVLEGEKKLGSITNEDGFYSMPPVNPGTYKITVSLIGYKTVSKQINITANRVLSENFQLKPDAEMLDEAVVNAQKIESQTKVLTGVISLNPKKIEAFSAGGDADIIRAIQVLPGVVTTGDQGGQLFIRGGAPIQNLTLLDGMIIYNPFHSIGFYSVFDADLLRSADVYTGGFGAQYGSRNSSVMDFKTRSGKFDNFGGKASLSTFTGKLVLEGPLFKPKDAESSNISFLISAKKSYLSETAAILYPYIESQFDGLPFEFEDYYGKLSIRSDDGSEGNVYGFTFRDQVTFPPANRIGWTATGVGGDFKVVPSGSSSIIDGNLAYSNYAIGADFGDNKPRNSEISGFNGGVGFTYLMRESDQLKFGLQLFGYRTEYIVRTESGRDRDEIDNSTEFAGYFSYKFNLDRWLIEPGFRAQYYASLNEISPEPRLGIKYNLNENFRLKGSAGVFSQNLSAALSDRDVVNLFYGFVGTPNSIVSEFRGEELRYDRQNATHTILGFEWDITKKINLNVEGYYKRFDVIVNLNRNKIFEDNETNASQPDNLKKEFIVEQGYARGIDFLLKYEEKRTYVWLAYSLSEVVRDDGFVVYNPIFDRRHNVNLVATQLWGKNNSWELAVRYNFGTGFPFTPTQGNFNQLPFANQNNVPIPGFDYTTSNANAGVLFGDLNSRRLPNYHRTDVSIKKIFELKHKQKLEVSAGATNILNRDNIFFFDRASASRVDQLPILPTVSINYSF